MKNANAHDFSHYTTSLNLSQREIDNFKDRREEEVDEVWMLNPCLFPLHHSPSNSSHVHVCLSPPAVANTNKFCVFKKFHLCAYLVFSLLDPLKLHLIMPLLLGCSAFYKNDIQLSSLELMLSSLILETSLLIILAIAQYSEQCSWCACAHQPESGISHL